MCLHKKPVFRIAKNWNKPDAYSLEKNVASLPPNNIKNKIYQQTRILLNLRNITLSQKPKKTQKNTYGVIPFIQSSRKKKRNTIEFRNTNLGGKTIEKTKEVMTISLRIEVICKDQ